MHFLCVAPLVKNCLQLVCSYLMCTDMILSYVNETHALFGTTSSFFGSGGAGATQTSHFGTIITHTATATETAVSCRPPASKSLSYLVTTVQDLR